MTGMTKPPTVSIIVPCFNHGDYLNEAVSSVTSLGRSDVELVVLDDGSTDEHTREEMGRLETSGVCVIRQTNQGLAAARNNAIRSSKGRYIFPLDADDRLRGAWIDRAIRTLDVEPKVGVVYGDLEYFGVRTGRWTIGNFSLERLLQWNFIPCSALFRRVVWEQAGGYDGTMPVQGLEDWDFWLSAVERGWNFAYLPEVFFEYRQHQESMITRAGASEAETEAFIAKKHGLLYRRAWLPYLRERLSVKLAARHFGRLLAFRIASKFKRVAPPWPEP